MKPLKDLITLHQYDFTEDLLDGTKDNITEEHLNNGVIVPNLKKARYEICKKCEELNSLKMCKQCNCFMPLKTLIPSSSCPLQKW